MKKIVRLIRLKKLEKLEKELTVKTLSFIMAAGLLLIIVPFLAIAAGSESPQPDSKGDFRLLNQLFVTTRVTLKGGEENAPRIVAEDVNGVGEISYQWQAFSSNQGSYVNVSAGQSIRISEGLARKYEYEDSKSYFRCLATDEEDNLYVSDVLTVVLPQEQTDDSDTTTGPENSETIATIELLEPTEPTQPDETTTEPEVTTTQPAESTTEPAKETTSPTTAPTQPANDGGKQNDVPEDADPIDGKLLDPITDDEGEDPASKSNNIVTHRVVQVTTDENGIAFRTKGDANNTEDDDVVPAKNVVGVYAGRISGMGNVVMFMQSTPGLVVCIALPILLLIGYDYFRRSRFEKKQKDETAALMKELEELRAQRNKEE